jgi:subtilisin family serine protease
MKYFTTFTFVLVTTISFSQNKILFRLSNAASTQINKTSLPNGQLRLSTTNPEVNAIFLRYNFLELDPAFPLAAKFNHPSAVRVSRIFRAVIEPSRIQTITEELSRSAHFDFVYQEKEPITLLVPSDFSLQGGLATLALNKINATQAWDETQGSSSVKIAVLDNGYDITHPDIVNQVVYLDGNVSYQGSGSSHGLPVAGLAAAQTNNNLGISSIGFNSKLMLYKFGNIYNQMMHASLNGAKIINCSFYTSCSPSQAEQDIINMIVANGTLIVASAGNGTLDISCGAVSPVYPASYDNVVSVSGIDLDDTYFNNNNHFNFNNKVDLTAPGWTTFTTYDNNVYSVFSGTSASAPMVAGTLALMLATNTCLDPNLAEFLLKSTTNKSVNNATLFPENAPYVNLSGTGRLDAFEAVKAAKNWPANASLIGQIQGPNVICGSHQFKFGNTWTTLNSNLLTWSSSNPSGLSINASTGVATRLNNFSGQVIVTATFGGACGFSRTFPVVVGKGVPENLFSIGESVYCNSRTLMYNGFVSPVPGATNYQWFVKTGNNPYVATSINGPTQYSMNWAISRTQTQFFKIVVTTPCGNLEAEDGPYQAIPSDCSDGNRIALSAYPNPATNTLTIELLDSATNNTDMKMSEVYQVYLMDRLSKKVFEGQLQDRKMLLPTENLQPGIYYLNVFYKDQALRKQIIIKK